MRHDGRVQTDWFGTPLRPLAGGYSGETFLVGGDGDEQVLRIYGRSPHRCQVDAALLRLLEGIIPVPRILECRPADGDNPGVLVTERLPGVRLDLVLAEGSPNRLSAIGHDLGKILAALSGIPQVRFGMFVDADLSISSLEVPDSLVAWADHCRDSGHLAGWRDEDYRALVRLLAGADERLAGEPVSGDRPPGPGLTRVVLAHSDFNPKNLLVDPDSGRITGVLDWEFAHAGSPYTDLGNLTRFERHPALVDSVLSTLVDRAPALASNPADLARCADLWALVELAGRARGGAVPDLASTLLLTQARSGDLHAWQWDSARVDPATSNAVF